MGKFCIVQESVSELSPNPSPAMEISHYNSYDTVVHHLFNPLDIYVNIFTGRNEVVTKVMFLHVSVIHSVHGGSPENLPPPRTRQTPPRTKENPPQGPGRHPPRPRRTPPDQGEPPPDKGEHPPPGPGRHTHPRTKENPPPPGRRLQHTVNERPVRILLECILVILVCTFSEVLKCFCI